MKNLIYSIVCLLIFSACRYREDYGALQEGEKTIQLDNFQKLEMGHAFVIEVKQGTEFSIQAKGDKRNLEDLEAMVSDGKLRIRYKNSANRHYTTYLYITMPHLEEVDFSGASKATITGFSEITSFKMILQGASMCQMQLSAANFDLNISGASKLEIVGGSANKITANISGASFLDASWIKTEEALLDVSGASTAKVDVNKRLEVVASGASTVRYKGNPIVESSLSGASQIEKD